MTERPEPPILFFDGACGVCSAMVAFILRHDRRRRTLRFASLQGSAGSELRALHHELGSVDSMVWYQPSGGGHRTLAKTRSEAAIATGIYLGGVWGVAARVAQLVPPTVRNSVYDAFARRRHRLTRYTTDCLLPSPDEAPRFLDLRAGADSKG